MSSIIEKAAKGNRAALTRLYNQNKDTLFFMARQLLGDDEKAVQAVTDTVKDVFVLSAMEQFSDEKAVTAALQTTLAHRCRAVLSRQNAKSVRMPSDRRFDIRTLPATLPEDDTEAVFSVFSDLQRILFVLNTTSVLDDEQIAAVTRLDTRTLHDALQAEKANVEFVLKGNSYNAFTKAFADKQEAVTAPAALNEAVDGLIGTVVAPIEKAKKKRTLTIVISTFAVCLVIIGLCALIIWDVTTPDPERPTGGDDPSSATTTTTHPAMNSAGTVTSVTPTHYAEIDIKDYGVITVGLDSTTAPETVFNFLKLAESGFYDGLTFHRIMEGFMMQGGDPQGTGMGGSGETIKGEFGSNGFENPLSHVRGAISMARSDAPNSASSQFFIVHEDSPFLDGDYAAFGYVTDGMDVVDAVCEAAKPTDGNGTIPADQQPVINSITVREAV